MKVSVGGSDIGEGGRRGGKGEAVVYWVWGEAIVLLLSVSSDSCQYLTFFHSRIACDIEVLFMLSQNF